MNNTTSKNNSTTLDSDEKAVLSLPPKTAIEGILKFEDFKTEIGKISTKVRWEIQKEEGEKTLWDKKLIKNLVRGHGQELHL